MVPANRTPRIIDQSSVDRRTRWLATIRSLAGTFQASSAEIENRLALECVAEGSAALLSHLRLSGDMPESFGHDSSEEKLYSKYTDALLSETFKALGMKSIILQERADAADVEAFAEEYDLVADAKAFRLSRTAKNQKDFKVEAMHGWKRGKHYAMIVCPIHQLPSTSSQIYQQASARNVCIFTYAHLAVLVEVRVAEGVQRAQALLRAIFDAVPALNPSKSAAPYWHTINSTMLRFSPIVQPLWQREKQASLEALNVGKQEALAFLASERQRMVKMSREEAVRELLKVSKVESKVRTINAVSISEIMGIME